MQRRCDLPLIVAVAAVLPAFGPAAPAWAQAVTQPAGDVTPHSMHRVTAAGLPIPPVSSAGSPSAFLDAARRAAVAGRTGEALDALERAEIRLLDRELPPDSAVRPDNRQVVLAIGAARRALAVHDRQATLAAIDDALAAANHPDVAAPASPVTMTLPAGSLPPEPQQTVVTRALRPGHWALHGARYVWVPPETTPRRVQSAALVPGAYVWRNGAYMWVAAHDAH